MNFIMQPWTWYLSGTVIAFVMFLMLYFGKVFGVSSFFRNICAACGAGKRIKYFDFDWKSQMWNAWFLVGAIIGGFISAHYLTNGDPILISKATIVDLKALGLSSPVSMQPDELFGVHVLSTFKGWMVLLGGGLLIGFGTRYANGCTSGHAISGLSNLQLPSLIAVIGFFIGGLIMTHFLLPYLLP